MQSTNFDVIQGDTWSIDIEYEDAEGNPINISNYNILAEVKDKPGGNLLCASSQSENGIELINFPEKNNAIRVTFTPEKTSKFNIPKCAYQIKVIETGDTLLSGWIKVDPGVIDG
jgi:hypothetical protein